MHQFTAGPASSFGPAKGAGGKKYVDSVNFSGADSNIEVVDNAYKRRLVLFYLSNAASGLRFQSKEARNLVQWLSMHEEELNLEQPLTPRAATGENPARPPSEDHKVSSLDWQCMGRALRHEFLRARHVRPDRTGRRLRRLAKTMRLPPTDLAIVELLLEIQTNPSVERMYREIFAPDFDGFYIGKEIACLLAVSFNALWQRFAPDAPLVRSGLVFLQPDGEVSLINRLTRLCWLPDKADSDVRRLLLDQAKPGELRWSDFDHVADRDHVERLVKGALRTGETGVNVLAYGPPGSGKTEFCKMLATRLRTPLYVVGEQDADGDEPSRGQRLEDLRLAQHLLHGDHGAILLFDEMEDLLSDPGGVWAATFGSRRGRRLEGVHEPAS